ncbi:MAG TPA: hypothetical protein DIV79_13290 [Opitutae bacterium]|nr:hypothetical protein [Opitutaceae bacterium]HCR30981.1 hypothetical protein [Opitutae bacterium]|tara:strand:+ start:828 stop:1406 length:579 start_codon:yes stop_codon:yes gene_type:complete
MHSIEQVTKRLSADRNWFNKCMLGVLFSIIPLVHFVAFGYLYRLFLQGKRQEEISLPEWSDWKELFVDGLKCFLVVFLFAFVPIALVTAMVSVFPWDSFLSRVPLAPAYFFAGPLSCSALYLYTLTGDFKSCFNFQAIGGLLRKGTQRYWVPTMAFLGLTLMIPFAYFVGGVIYFYLMGDNFKNLERKADGN